MSALLYRDDAYLKSCDARVVGAQDGALELDRTVFYPAGGGQPGDRGILRFEDGTALHVIDTRRGEVSDRVLHLLAPGSPLPVPGSAVRAEIDWEARYRHMRLHTALHLLCAVVKAPVTGGRIGEDKAHLDFDIEMEKLDKASIEAELNTLVQRGITTRTRWVSDAELDASPELVRTMSVAPPRGEGRVRLLEISGVDLQACGGTHVADTAEIGPLRIARIRSEGRHNKRVTLEFAR
jgi:misacylated tRNA(Ala) deacylase